MHYLSSILQDVPNVIASQKSRLMKSKSKLKDMREPLKRVGRPQVGSSSFDVGGKQSESPLITVIIATYNCKDGLVKTLDELEKQTYKNFEVIVVDGNSQDGTVGVLKEYDEKISFWISEKDGGIYDAWNKGLRYSLGSWVCFLGAGDYFVENGIARYVEEINKSKNTLYVSARSKLYNNTRTIRTIGRKWEWERFRRFMCVCHAGSMHNIELFNKYGVFNSRYKVAGDYELLLRAQKNLDVAFIDDVLVFMESGGVSDTSILVFKETAIAKLNHAGLKFIVVAYDALIAYLKWRVRRVLDK